MKTPEKFTRLAPATLAVLLLGALATAASAGRATAQAPPGSWRIEKEGIAIELLIEPLDPASGGELREGDNVLVRINITDTTTREPWSGLYPAAWMSLRDPSPQAPAASCIHQVEELIAGSILNQPELDFNVYYVLAMNEDSTITVVDPLFGFGGSKLLALIRLKSRGEDWLLTPDQRTLFVTLPEAHRVAVADTAAWKVTAEIELSSPPHRIVAQPDGKYLWVSVEGADKSGRDSGVVVIDRQGQRVVAEIPTGLGPHDIAIRGDSRYAFVTNRDAGTVSVIDVLELEEVESIATGGRPVSVAYSSFAQVAYVSDEQIGTLIAIDGKSLAVTARLEAKPGLGPVRFEPQGRFAFLVNPETDLLHIVDSASNRIIQSGTMKEGPDQVTFSDELAYIRHRGSGTVLMVPLVGVGIVDAPIEIADFPGGQRAFGETPYPTPADAIVQAPGANAVLVANPADDMIYFYKEGMAAPMGGFTNYKRHPRAVLVVDRSLGEHTRPGSYETAAQLRSPGRYDIAFYLDTPRIVHCFEAEVKPNPVLEAARQDKLPTEVEPVGPTGSVVAGTTTRLRFHLRDPRSGELEKDLGDVLVLVHRSGNWQSRLAATEVEPGTYEVAVELPTPGAYVARVECLSRNLRLHMSTPIKLQAVAKAPAAEAATGGQP